MIEPDFPIESHQTDAYRFVMKFKYWSYTVEEQDEQEEQEEEQEEEEQDEQEEQQEEREHFHEYLLTVFPFVLKNNVMTDTVNFMVYIRNNNLSIELHPLEREANKKDHQDDPRKWIKGIKYVELNDSQQTYFPGYDQMKCLCLILRCLNLNGSTRPSKSDILSIAVSRRWVSDYVVDQYLKLITQRSDDKIFAFNSQFYKDLKYRGEAGVAGYNRKRKRNYFNDEKLMFPIIFEHHWLLIVVKMEPGRCTLFYYDSLQSSTESNMDTHMSLIEDYLVNLYKKLYNNATLTVERSETSCSPYQSNEDDCGAYVCTNAEWNSRGRESTFTEFDIEIFRQKIANELLCGRLMDTI